MGMLFNLIEIVFFFLCMDAAMLEQDVVNEQ